MIIDAPVDQRPTDTTSPPASTPDPSNEPGAAERMRPAPALAWLLAALSVGAAVVHLAMVPQHAAASVGMGVAFAAAGWFQIAFGVGMVARPNRTLAQVGIVANLAFIAAWAVSRTWGLPAWTGDGGVEPVSAVDGFCVALEVGVVVTAALSLVASNALRTRPRPFAVLSAVVSTGVLVATTAVLASPQAANHAHGGGPDQVVTAAGAANATTAPPHDHSSTTTAAAPSSGAATPTTAAGGHTHGAPGAPGEDGADARHHGESDVTLAELPADTRAEVDKVIAEWATKYPTGADAMAAGWFRATPNLYGIGAHYIHSVQGFSVALPFDMMKPTILLYDGEGPDAKFAGVSYVVAGGAEGFTGPYDFWHEHESVCMSDGKITLTEEGSKYWYSESECRAVGGRILPIAGDLMIHLWIGPGYTDAPIFAHDNPEIYDGYYPKHQS